MIKPGELVRKLYSHVPNHSPPQPLSSGAALRFTGTVTLSVRHAVGHGYLTVTDGREVLEVRIEHLRFSTDCS